MTFNLINEDFVYIYFLYLIFNSLFKIVFKALI